MYFDDAKKTATVIAGKRDAKGERTQAPTPMKLEHVADENGMVDGKHVAAQEIMGAMHEQSPLKLMDALSNFMEIHNNKKENIIHE